MRALIEKLVQGLPEVTPMPDMVSRKRHIDVTREPLRVLDLPGLQGPPRTLIVEAKTWETMAKIAGWAFDQLDAATTPVGALSRTRPGTRIVVADRRADPDLKAGVALGTVPAFPGARPGEKPGDKRRGAAAALGVGAAAGGVQAVRVLKKVTGAAGAAFMPTRNAWDDAAKRGNGAPMAVFWRQPDTLVCEVAMVPASAANSLRNGLFNCDVAAAHGDGAVIASYENGRLGPSDGPALQFLGSSGAPSAPPVFCLDGAKVSPEAHAAGNPQPFSGGALAASLLGGGDARLPGGQVNVNLAGLDGELAKAQRQISDWLNGNDPAMRLRQAQAEELLKQAGAHIAEARKQVSELRGGGAVSAWIDFPAYGSPAGLVRGLPQDLEKAKVEAKIGADEVGLALTMRSKT